MTDAEPPFPLDELEAHTKRALRAAALNAQRQLAPLEGALSAYRRALEAEVAREFALAHSLPQPRAGGPTREAAARTLWALVRELPELRVDTPAGEEPTGEPVGEPARSPRPVDNAAPDGPTALGQVLPRIAAALAHQNVVILGALGGRKRDLPEPLGAQTEWIDTSQGGAHAVGNLPARIRQGRVLGVVICESAISHKHTDPVIAAARASAVPLGFAGKGGNAGIARALRAIEAQLSADPTPPAPSKSTAHGR